jgi:hypothetical protein
VVADVVLHQFPHPAVDGAARGQALQDVGAVPVLFNGAERGFQLADDFLGAGTTTSFSRFKCGD